MTSKATIFYTRLLETAPRLKLDYKENAGIDLYPDISKIFVISHEEGAKITFQDDSVVFTVYHVPFVVSISSPYKIAFPQSIHGIVYGRSGNFFKRGIDVFKGVIDSSYRGEIGVGLIFNKTGVFRISNDTAIAQLVMIPFGNCDYELVEVDNDYFERELSKTSRGEKGFGSTGYVKEG